jgi:hypothetical protein
MNEGAVVAADDVLQDALVQDAVGQDASLDFLTSWGFQVLQRR